MRAYALNNYELRIMNYEGVCSDNCQIVNCQIRTVYESTFLCYLSNSLHSNGKYCMYLCG